jgi:hypothetical protein
MSGWTYIDDTRKRDDDAKTHPHAAHSGGDAQSAGSQRDADSVTEVGSVVANRYLLKSYVGKGRYGEVYKAVDRSLSDPQLQQEHAVALHLLYDRITQQTPFLQKLESSYHQPHLWSHPNIVKVRGFGCDRGKYFLVMELLDGVSLRSILDETPSELLSESEALAVLRAVGDALKYAHAKGAIHGDIRPEKIFITGDYAIKVLDLLPTSATGAVPFFVEDAGPDGPAAPDQRDDVYGLACLAYELLSGRHPFNANSPLEALNAGLTLAPIPGLTAQRWVALARGLALRREHRTASVAGFLAELGITGNETLRPAGETAAGEPTLPASAPAQPTRPQYDDVPIIGDYSTAENAPTRPAASPAKTQPRRAALPESDAWQRSTRDFDTYADFVHRRERGAPRRTGWRFATVAVLAAAVGVAIYWNYETVQSRTVEWLATARTLAEGAAGDGARAPSEEGEGEATVVAPPIATVPPDVATGVADAPPRDVVDAPLRDVVDPAAADAEASPRATDARADSAPVQVAEAPPVATRSEPPAAPGAPAVEPVIRTEAPVPVAERPEPIPAAAAVAPAAASVEPETFEFATRVVTISEGQAVAAVPIRRRGGNFGESSIAWWTSDGSASADDDYANLGARIETFAAGEEVRTVHIPIVVDARSEGRESFYVSLRASEQPGARLEPAQRIEVVIVDDD